MIRGQEQERVVLYPQETIWPESKIRMALKDAIANEEVDADVVNPDTDDLDYVCQLLEDTVKVGFSRKTPDEFRESLTAFERQVQMDFELV